VAGAYPEDGQHVLVTEQGHGDANLLILRLVASWGYLGGEEGVQKSPLRPQAASSELSQTIAMEGRQDCVKLLGAPEWDSRPGPARFMIPPAPLASNSQPQTQFAKARLGISPHQGTGAGCGVWSYQFLRADDE
jgi:hypothetical protein